MVVRRYACADGVPSARIADCARMKKRIRALSAILWKTTPNRLCFYP